jgi:anti-sigma regulatory factor (Ser/Thr protein kinase)
LIRFDTIVRVSDPTGASEARRAATLRATSIGFDETAAGRVALVATELATNLVKHGGGGSILIGADDEAPRQMHLLAVDKGKGITSLPAAMQDGFSTAGSPGTGLGAIRRSATTFNVFSLPDRGTVVSCCIQNGSAQSRHSIARSNVSVAGICLPKPPEEVSGDSWDGVSSTSEVSVIVADGLGHGLAAATASSAAIRSFHESAKLPVEEIVRTAHGALRSTRGAAIAVARIYSHVGKIEYAGVGNIAATIVDDEGTRRAVSHNGIVGHELRKLQMFSYPWRASGILLMHSDGVGTAWSVDQYPGLRAQPAEVIAAVIHRDFCRGSDDATIVVAKGRA